MKTPLPALNGGTTLITVNKRLAGALRERHDTAQATRGASVWESPDILPWGAWLQRTYLQLVDSGHCTLDLLTRSQEITLWERVINQRDDLPLLRPGAAAELASDAFARCCAWSLDLDTVAADAGPDTRVFAGWCRAFRRATENQGFMTMAELPDCVRRAYQAGHLVAPANLVHAGFDSFTPDQQALLDGLAALGCSVSALPTAGRNAQCRRVVASDAEHEIRLAARWVAAELATTPTARLAVVSPVLGVLRQPILRIFTQILAPATYLGRPGVAPPFNLSLGEPLADKALAAHALLALRLLTGPQDLASIGQLLRSPFIGGHDSEWQQRALLDARLRADGRPTLDLADLLHRLRQFASDDPAACPDLRARLAALARIRADAGRAVSPAVWAEILRGALQQLGWPGQHALDSAEFQQYQHVLELFDELGALGKVRQRLTRSEAIGQLARLASDTVFQPQTTAKPVQVLGILEAAGMQFDAIWLLGMDDSRWPPAPRPNPLLPAALQRELGMPQAAAEHELAFATELTDGLTRSADHIIASHAQADDEQLLLPSALIAGWQIMDTDGLQTGAPGTLQTACSGSGTWLPMPDPNASAGPVTARGGAALLATQAGCPFAAVARFRLAASPLDEPTHAPDAAMTGSLIHRLLERVWATLENSATLARQDAASLRRLIAPLAAQVLDIAQRRRPDLYTPRFCALEAGRFTELMLAWLAIERQRSQAFDVLALERDRSVVINGVELRTRADRIDRLADGSIAVIDYKTGRSVSHAGWFDERLSEPQLPLYAVTTDDAVGATLLARVRQDTTGCRLLGLSRADDFGGGVETPGDQAEDLDWPGLLAHWHAGLDALAAEFSAGRADPTPSPQACAYCPLGGLCRVQQRQVENHDD